jgi:hypothetical protein
VTNQTVSVDFDGRTYTLVSHEKSFSDNTFEFDADDGLESDRRKLPDMRRHGG